MLTDKLYYECEAEGLLICENEYTGKAPALIDGNEILLSKKLETQAERNDNIIHEFGHYKTTPNINLLYVDQGARDRLEYRATRAGVLAFITLDKLLSAYKRGCRDCWEYCEELEITEQFFLRALEIFANVHGPIVNHNGWLFTFNPLHIRRTKKK